jgi:hypothetical protein
MRSKHSQYTIRNVPPEIDRALRKRARRLGKSLNEVALRALAMAVGVEMQPQRHDDLEAFFGSWVEDKEVDRALAEQRSIDEKMWK